MPELNQQEYNELMELLEDQGRTKILLQNINDTIQGGIRSANLREYRNTYVINAQDSLDEIYPMYVHFNIISEMTRIVSIKLSFWFLNFRAYSKAGAATGTPSGGGVTKTSSYKTTPSGGADTTGYKGSASGGADTTGIIGDIAYLTTYVHNANGVDYLTLNTGSLSAGRLYTYGGAYNLENHYHTTPNHTHPNHYHTTPNHTHPTHAHTVTIPNHTHPNHTHTAVYGIFEEETSPTIVPSISRDNGLTYSLPIGSYTKDQENLDITRFIDKAGSKMIKFTSNIRARLSVQIEIKLDIKAR
ncbi:hypothetical protein ES705_38736 [subsurface metagenome]